MQLINKHLQLHIITILRLNDVFETIGAWHPSP